MRKVSRGFSLIELLIVVAIILIIAAMAIPNLLSAKRAANQVSAVSSLRTINTSEITYASTYNTGYTWNLASLGPPVAGGACATAGPNCAGFIDEVLVSATKSGYTFVYKGFDGAGALLAAAPVAPARCETYTITGDATSQGQTGVTHYFTDNSGVIRQNSTGAAAVTDPPIGK